MKLGKLPARPDPRVPAFARRLKLIQPAEAVDWTARVAEWPMLANDRVGDCTAAAVYHLIQCWRANAWGDHWQPQDAAALTLYAATSDYPKADNGAVVVDVLNHWAALGVPAPGELDVAAAVRLDPLNVAELKLSVQWFGGVYLGLQLPEAAMADGDWDFGPGLPIAGGHAVCAVAYDQDGATLVTWGTLRRASWRFLLAYMDEAYACVSRAWLNASGMSPAGLSWEQLQADMAGLAVA